jgi:hypothetical protein
LFCSWSGLEGKSVRQFLSKMMTSLITRSTRKRSHIYVAFVAGLASSLVVGGYLAQGNSSVDVIRRLLVGFAPLIGLFFLLLLLTFLYTILLSSVERILACDDENVVPEKEKKNKWRVVRSFISPPLTTHYLSLKEHSPPALPATLASAK